MTYQLGAWQKRCFFLLFLWLSSPTIAGATPEVTQLRAEAHRTSQRIKIDGELSEADWQRVEPIRRFVQIEPDEGKPISQPTEVRILYDNRNLYFGFTCSDSDISQLVANELRRDSRLYENDSVYVLLDTYNDRRGGFFFRVNALGAMQDTSISGSGDTWNNNWDAVWTCRAKINEDNWTAEIAIPFSQLRFTQSDVMEWGMNLGRKISRNNEEATWAPVSKAYREGGVREFRTANIGSLSGLKGISPSRHIELLPYVLPGISQSEDNEIQTKRVLDIGLDVKYGITPNLTGDLTFNTDFAQVEADQEQINLTRFSLFFPEKRPFFLEGSGFFDFGISSNSWFHRLLFYSRRIGLEGGRAIPIIAGGKVTGKIGEYGVGFLNVLTNEFDNTSSAVDADDVIVVPRTNFTVLRAKRDISKGSTVGLIATNKQDADTYNRSAGVDFVYRPFDNMDVNGVWARTLDEGQPDQNDAWTLGSRWRNDRFMLEGAYMDIGENLNPEVGFVQRKGVRRFRTDMRYTPWPGVLGIRRIITGPEIGLFFDPDGELVTRILTLSDWVNFESDDWLQFGAQRIMERLDEDFEVHEGFVIPAGEHYFSKYNVGIFTDRAEKISGYFRLNLGGFFNGDKRGFESGANFNPSPQVLIESRYQFNRVTLPDGSFNTHVVGTRVVYSVSTTLFGKMYAQWNSSREVVSTNFLLNYIYNPGSDFYLVFNQNYDSGGAAIRHIDSTLVGKMTYWWNL